MELVAGVLLEAAVSPKDISVKREDERVAICISLLIPPSIKELPEADKVDTATPFGEELTAPFGEHLLEIKLCRTLRGVESRRPVGRWVVTLTDAIQQLGCCGRIATAELAFGEAVDDLRQADLTVVCLELP